MHYLDMVYLLWKRMYDMLKDEKLARKLLSVDGTEYVFIKKPEKLQELKKLENEVWHIYEALRN